MGAENGSGGGRYMNAGKRGCTACHLQHSNYRSPGSRAIRDILEGHPGKGGEVSSARRVQ